MTCRKCGGRVCVDRVYSDNKRFDLYCILCGKRTFVNRLNNAFGAWLNKHEKGFANASL